MTLPNPVAYCPECGLRLREFVSNKPEAESHVCLRCWLVIGLKEFYALAEEQGGVLRENDPHPPGEPTRAKCDKCGLDVTDMRKLKGHGLKCGATIKFYVSVRR